MDRKGPLYVIPWKCTSACDGACLHCVSAGKPPAMDELSASEAMRMVDQIYEFGASWLGISGGEPFLRDDLFEVVRYAMMVGLNVSLITSGRHFDSKKI